MEETPNLSERINETESTSMDQPSESKMKRLGGYMKETLEEMFRTLRHPEFKFAISGLVITIVLVLISLFFFVAPAFIGNENHEIVLASFVIPFNWIGIVISFIIAVLVIFLWFLLGLKVTPKAAHLLVDNKILKFFFTKGDVHYLEYVPPEKRKIAMPDILNKYILLLLAWVSVSAFLMNLVATLLADGNPTVILNPGQDIIFFILRTLILFILVPIVFTLIYPLAWMLIDARLKAYNSGTKLNWLVGKKVANLTGGFITLGSLAALGADAISDWTNRAQLMVDLVLFCIINVSLIVVLVVFFYNIFFKGKFYQMIVEEVEVGFGVTSVTLTDEKGEPLLELKPEPEAEPVPEPEAEPVPEPEAEPENEKLWSYTSEEE
ncbi:MAG: hypothetical protein ACFFFH_10250 [Candidatus Thorarchaeota archaeon]